MFIYMGKIIREIYKNMDLLEDLKMSLLNLSFIMIYTIHKILVLIQNHLNHLKNNIFECLFKEYKYNTFNFFKKIIIFFIIYNNRKYKS